MSDEQQVDQLHDQRDADEQDQHDERSHETDDLGDKGKAALKAERDARRLAEKERADLAKRLADFEKAQQAAEDAKAKEQGEWEQIAAKREAELDELRKAIADRDLKDRRNAVATAHGIPDDLRHLLLGETDEDIETNAKALAKHLKPREAPDTDAGQRTAPGAKKPDKAKFSDPAMWGLRK